MIRRQTEHHNAASDLRCPGWVAAGSPVRVHPRAHPRALNPVYAASVSCRCPQRCRRSDPPQRRPRAIRRAPRAVAHVARPGPSQPIPKSNCWAASVSGFVQPGLSAILACRARALARSPSFLRRAIDTARGRRIKPIRYDKYPVYAGYPLEPDSTVHTDGWKGYNDIPKHGYVRKMTVLASSEDPAHVVMPGVHRIASLLKRWLLGTHQGAVSNRHLDYYLDEYTFRFNRRSYTSRGLLFYRLMQQAACTPKTPYRSLIGGADTAGASARS